MQSSHDLVFDQKIGHKLYIEAVLFVDFLLGDFQRCELGRLILPNNGKRGASLKPLWTLEQMDLHFRIKPVFLYAKCLVLSLDVYIM